MTDARPSPAPYVLVVGKSKTVLDRTVGLLRAKGYTAEATSEFDHLLDMFDTAALDVVVFGGMVPPDTKNHLRQEISDGNPRVIYVQGFAGIPGLIAAQVEAAVGPRDSDAEVDYEPASRSIRLTLQRARAVVVVAWWHTALVPPEPQSTSMTVAHTELPAGAHTIPLPGEIPTRASFVTVSIGSSVSAFIVGAMPSGTTLAQFPDTANISTGRSVG